MQTVNLFRIFGIYIFSAPDGLQGYWEPAVVYDYKYPGDGVFEISFCQEIIMCRRGVTIQ